MPGFGTPLARNCTRLRRRDNLNAMRRFQFSLRMMLAAVAVVGIGATLWVAEPSWQLGAFETLLLTFAPAASIILVINSGGMAGILDWNRHYVCVHSDYRASSKHSDATIRFEHHPKSIR